MSDKIKVPAGAKEKYATAKKMREEGYYDTHTSGGGGGRVQYPSQTIAITIIFAIGVILAFMQTGSTSNPLSGMHPTGFRAIDSFVTGTDIPHFTGDPDQDKVITIMGRGFAFFILAGIIPLISLVLDRLFFDRRVMPFITCWGVIVFALLIYLSVPGGIGGFSEGLVSFVKSF